MNMIQNIVKLPKYCLKLLKKKATGTKDILKNTRSKLFVTTSHDEEKGSDAIASAQERAGKIRAVFSNTFRVFSAGTKK